MSSGDERNILLNVETKLKVLENNFNHITDNNIINAIINEMNTLECKKKLLLQMIRL